MAASLRDWRQWRISETPSLHPLSRHALGPPTSFRREDVTAGGAETSLLSGKLGHCAHIKQWSPHHGGPRWRRLWRRLDINGTSLVYYTQQYTDGRIMRYQRTSSCTVIFWLVFFSLFSCLFNQDPYWFSPCEDYFSWGPHKHRQEVTIITNQSG